MVIKWSKSLHDFLEELQKGRKSNEDKASCVATAPLLLTRSSKDECSTGSNNHLREVFKKSKWKFKMAFAMKGGGGLECHIPILKNDFC